MPRFLSPSISRRSSLPGRTSCRSSLPGRTMQTTTKSVARCRRSTARTPHFGGGRQAGSVPHLKERGLPFILAPCTYQAALLLVALATLGSPSARADEPQSIKLFNGTDLSGWTYFLGDSEKQLEDVWSVQDGVLHCTGNPAGYLITQREFDNYVLTLEWRWPGQGGNNGVLVHCTDPQVLGVWPRSLEVQLQANEAGDFWVIGTEIEIDNPEGRIQGRRHRNLTDDSEHDLGEWNTMRITCRGDTVRVEVNGDLVNECRNLSYDNASHTRGAIALQSEGAPIEYRNIVLHPLADE